MSLGPRDLCQLVFHYSIPNQHRLSIDTLHMTIRHKSPTNPPKPKQLVSRGEAGGFSTVSRAPNLDLLGVQNTWGRKVPGREGRMQPRSSPIDRHKPVQRSNVVSAEVRDPILVSWVSPAGLSLKLVHMQRKLPLRTTVGCWPDTELLVGFS